MGRGNISYRCLRFLHSKTSVLIVLYLLDLLVVKNEVKLEKKTAYGKKIKAIELFSGNTSKKHVLFLQFVNIYIISPTKQNFAMNL